jgi:hypothetical protein
LADSRVVILFDENLPHRVVRALREELGEAAYHVYDVLHPGAPDEVVFQYAGERDWCVLSSDRAILSRPHERRVIHDYGMGTFFLNDSIKGLCKITRTVFRHWPEMKRLARVEAKPFLFLVKENSIKRIQKGALGKRRREDTEG